MIISAAHDIDAIDKTLEVFKEALTVVKEAIDKGAVEDYLDGDIIQPVIRKID
ncbi:MAG: hypothetical protein NE330_03825 [Lentisphaeraceae bacterium]|nr:hypothetical protein [Lentisphaeraceae bacterium]